MNALLLHDHACACGSNHYVTLQKLERLVCLVLLGIKPRHYGAHDETKADHEIASEIAAKNHKFRFAVSCSDSCVAEQAAAYWY
eukprot:14114-Heterococcus_DN1.PRE.2